MMEMPLGFRVSGPLLSKGPIKSNIPACAGIFMRGDYVPPNTAPVCLGALDNLGCAHVCAPEGKLEAG